MDTQEHEYELGTLEDEILDRDESKARQGGNQGDERRWMILGGAGTLALLAAMVTAISLGGTGSPHKLTASLRGPVRDLSAMSAHLQSAASATLTAVAPVAATPTRVARGPVAPAQPVAQTPAAPAPAPATITNAPAATPEGSAAVHAAVDPDADEGSFANLPVLSAAEAAADDDTVADEASDGVRTNFEQDANPFADDPSASDDESPDEDDESAQDDAGKSDARAVEVTELPTPV